MPTVQEVIDEGLDRADMEGTKFIKPDKLLSYFNRAFSAYYSLIVNIFEDEFVSPTYHPFTIASGGDSSEPVFAPLPADFYKMRGLDRTNKGEPFPIRKFQFMDRSRSHANQPIWGFYPPVRYRLWGSQLLFDDSANAPGDYRLWYIPKAQVFTAATETVEFPNQFRQDYVVADIARRCLAKQEGDTRSTEDEMLFLERKILEFERDRDAGEPEVITDTNAWGDRALNLTGFDSF